MSTELRADQSWQFCYVEKWADDSGVYERVTFSDLGTAQRYLTDNASVVEGLNAESGPADRIVASVERRIITDPGEWESVLVPVQQDRAEEAQK